jgi:hypothetical protein
LHVSVSVWLIWERYQDIVEGIGLHERHGMVANRLGARHLLVAKEIDKRDEPHATRLSSGPVPQIRSFVNNVNKEGRCFEVCLRAMASDRRRVAFIPDLITSGLEIRPTDGLEVDVAF